MKLVILTIEVNQRCVHAEELSRRRDRNAKCDVLCMPV